MAVDLKRLFDDAVSGQAANLEVLQARGLVRRQLSPIELDDEMCREAIVETAMSNFVIRTKSERLEILSALGADNRYDRAMAADIMMQPVSDQKTTLSLLEDKAIAIWQKAVGPVRELSKEFALDLSKAEGELARGDLGAVREFFEINGSRSRGLEEDFQAAFRAAKRELRNEFNGEFGRFWEPEISEAYTTIIDRAVFLPPEEYRAVMTQVTDLRQNLVKEQEFASELRKRIDNAPEHTSATPSPSPSMKP